MKFLIFIAALVAGQMACAEEKPAPIEGRILIKINRNEEKVQKCTDANGKVTFSNEGCNTKEKIEHLTVTPNVIDSSGLRRLQAIGYGKNAGYIAPKVPVAEYRDPIECDNAKRMYEFEAGYRYRKSESLNLKRNEVFRTCGYWP